MKLEEAVAQIIMDCKQGEKRACQVLKYVCFEYGKNSIFKGEKMLYAIGACAVERGLKGNVGWNPDINIGYNR